MIRTRKIIGTITYLGGLPATLEKFTWAWGQLIQYNSEFLCKPGEIVHYLKATVSYHSFARNSIVEGMLGDWLLMLDTDHAFEPDLAMRMLYQMDRANADVVGAVYCHRAAPNSPVLYQWDKDDKLLQPLGMWSNKHASHVQVGSMGAGSLMIRRSVFRRIYDELKEGPFDIIPPFGEDHSFFKRLQKLGIKAYALPQIESPHLDVKPLTLSGYHPEGQLLKQKKQVAGYI